MQTIFSQQHRRRVLDQAVANLVREGYEIVERSDLRAVLRRTSYRLLIPREVRIVLEVDAYGRVQRVTDCSK